MPWVRYGCAVQVFAQWPASCELRGDPQWTEAADATARDRRIVFGEPLQVFKGHTFCVISVAIDAADMSTIGRRMGATEDSKRGGGAGVAVGTACGEVACSGCAAV